MFTHNYKKKKYNSVKQETDRHASRNVIFIWN